MKNQIKQVLQLYMAVANDTADERGQSNKECQKKSKAMMYLPFILTSCKLLIKEGVINECAMQVMKLIKKISL